MPKDTDEEKAARREAMQNGLKAAAQVPLSVAETAYKIFPIAEAVVSRGNTNAVTDGLVAAMMARTAVIGALFNVKINLGSIKDEAFVADLSAKVKSLEETSYINYSVNNNNPNKSNRWRGTYHENRYRNCTGINTIKHP